MKRSEAKKPVWARNMNEEQMAVILHDEGPLVCLAQAGSGKTRAVVHRICRLAEGGRRDERAREEARDDMGYVAFYARGSGIGNGRRLGVFPMKR